MTAVNTEFERQLRQEVVVAEDDPVTLQLIVCWLEDAGYRVTSATNGLEALAEVTRNRASVLITDWNMPEMNGFELCQQLRASEYRPYPYIIMATGREDRRDIERAINVGVDDYLVKPIQHDDLLTRIRQAHRVLQRLRAYVEKMETDELTGCLSRRRFEECLAIEIIQARQKRRPLSCLLMDLDWFKHINDRWGHGVGDRVLQVFAQVVTRVLGAGATVGRLGGDEFCALVPGLIETEAAVLAEKMRQEINAAHLEVESDRQISLSATIGVAGLRPGMEDSQALVDAADEGLLAAKRSGRNRVVAFGQLNDLHSLDKFSTNAYQTHLATIQACQIMTTPIVTLHQSNTLRHAADLFVRLRVTSIPVVDDDARLTGMISENDTLAAVATSFHWDSPIEGVMQRNVMSYPPTTPVDVIWQALDRVSVRHVVIADQTEPVGVISRGTLLRWMGNWGSLDSEQHQPTAAPNQALRQRIQCTAPEVERLVHALSQHADADAPTLVAETINTVSRVQEQVEELLTYCQVDYRFEPT